MTVTSLALGMTGVTLEILSEPLRRETGHFLERARLFEEMTGAGNDLDLVDRVHLLGSLSIHSDDRRVVAAHDEQRRRLYVGQSRAGQIGTAAARYHRGDSIRNS